MKDQRVFANVGVDAAELQKQAEERIAEEGVSEPGRLKLQKLLNRFYRYYTVNEETPLEPFAAEAEFRVHGEEFFLIRRAKYAEMDSREFYYFYLTDFLEPEEIAEINELAWNNGLSRMEIKEHHRNSDVIVCVIADRIPEETRKAIRKARYFKNYRHGLLGFSQFKLAAFELESGKTFTNYQGKPLKKLFA